MPWKRLIFRGGGAFQITIIRISLDLLVGSWQTRSHFKAETLLYWTQGYPGTRESNWGGTRVLKSWTPSSSTPKWYQMEGQIGFPSLEGYTSLGVSQFVPPPGTNSPFLRPCAVDYYKSLRATQSQFQIYAMKSTLFSLESQTLKLAFQDPICVSWTRVLSTKIPVQVEIFIHVGIWECGNLAMIWGNRDLTLGSTR